MELWQFLGRLHPKLVQFPLVLLLAALGFDAAGLVRRNERFHWAGRILAVAGTVVLLFAFICGIYAEIWAGRAGIPQHPIEWHEFMANIASWGFVVLTAWRLFLDGTRRKAMTAYVALGLGWYVLLVITGYLGGVLVFDYGAAVTGAQANTVLSMHDLNTLATRQTDLNLQYSEWMHHIFGWMTLALSGSLLAAALMPKRSGRIRWVGPALLLAGGVFLFFFADRDLYRLMDMRQLRDREVQLHKSLAIILVVVGVMGLRRDKTKAAAKSPTSSKMVAVMALIGGGMLFTHVHTVAPYANVAAGVYITHVVMGLVALTIGAARLLQDGFPAWRRTLATTFALFMLIESVLLLTYNEGLPWFIGYGTYNRWGPHHGTVAPYGRLRAELTFDPKTEAMDVYVLDRSANTPVAVKAGSVNVLVGRGYEELAVPLRAMDSSHFQGFVPSLKGTPAFSARMELPVEGVMKMGYFDPWVTPAIAAIPPNEVARYQCPMHEGILSENPGVCPLCGMPLVPVQRGPRMTLHDDEYQMDFSTVSAGVDSPDADALLLRFTPMHDHQVLRDLAVVHTKLLHLIIVSEDLSFFDHVHPVMEADGSLALPYRFPRPGHYVLFADITPAGSRSQVFRFALKVGASPEPYGLELTPSPAPAMPMEFDPAMTVELMPQPRQLVWGIHEHLLFRLYRAGQPLTDIEPYLGAMGHCVVISHDTQTYIHCHPEQIDTPTAESRGGPDIPFHVMFPRPGRYKLWAQFQRGGRVLTVPFVLDVDAPPLPPWVMNFILGD